MDIPHANIYRDQNQGRTRQRRPYQRNDVNIHQNRENENNRFHWEEFVGGVAAGASILKIFQLHPIITVVSVGLTVGIYLSKD